MWHVRKIETDNRIRTVVKSIGANGKMNEIDLDILKSDIEK